VAAAATVCSQDLGSRWCRCNLRNNIEIEYVIENDFAE
jgi:hypothetical protein